MRLDAKLGLLLVSGATTLALATPAAALTALDRGYGTALEGESARSLAMGSVGVSDLQGSGALVQNPALLAGIGGRALLDFQIGLRQVNEDRFVPLYDTFDDLIAETAYVINRNTYADAQGGLVYRLPLELPSVLAVGVYDRYDLDWDYDEELRDTSTSLGPDERDQLLQVNEAFSDGRIRSWSLGYAAELVQGVHLGAALHRYFGEVEQIQREIPVTGAMSSDALRRDLSGWGWSVGAEVRSGTRLAFGASIEAPVKLEGEHRADPAVASVTTPADGDYEVDYPLTYAVGLTLRPRNELRTTFVAEARFRRWEKLDDSFLAEAIRLGEENDVVVAGLDLRNTWDVRVGVEHVFYNGMPLRFGMRYVENYTDRESERTVFSAGTGWRAGGVAIDLSGQYHRQTSRQDFVFDAGAAGIPNPPLAPKVEDSVIRFVVGVTRAF